MRVQNERNRGVRTGVVVVTGFDPTGRTVDIHLRHEVLTSNETISTMGRGVRSLENGRRAAAAKLDSAAQEFYTNIRFRIVPNKDAPAIYGDGAVQASGRAS
jgi:hypothetical protein